MNEPPRDIRKGRSCATLPPGDKKSQTCFWRVIDNKAILRMAPRSCSPDTLHSLSCMKENMCYLLTKGTEGPEENCWVVLCFYIYTRYKKRYSSCHLNWDEKEEIITPKLAAGETAHERGGGGEGRGRAPGQSAVSALKAAEEGGGGLLCTQRASGFPHTRGGVRPASQILGTRRKQSL